jgi:glycosyltransferase involved in cell wall biosynthesis
MRKIGILLDIAPHGGGSHQWAVNICHALNDYRSSRRGVEVVILHYRSYPGRHPLKKLFPHFLFIELGGPSVLLARFLRRVAVTLPIFIPLLRLMFPLNRAARHAAIDLLVFPVTVFDSLLCDRPYVFFLADIAHVFHPHFPEVSAGGELRRRHLLFRLGLKRASRIVVESEQLRADIARYYAADPSKAHVIFQVLPRTLDQTDEVPSRRVADLPQPYIFFPAQLWKHKNHLNLLDAFVRLVPEFPDLRLVLCGSRKPGDETIFEHIRRLKLEQKVIYLGYVPDADMPTLYRRAVALVMPTFFGPTNIPTLEAFHFGCPAVISDLPGVIEQVKDAALRFDPNDPVEIASKLRLVLKDRDLAQAMTAAGHRRMEALSYDYYRSAIGRVFDNALDNP